MRRQPALVATVGLATNEGDNPRSPRNMLVDATGVLLLLAVLGPMLALLMFAGPLGLIGIGR